MRINVYRTIQRYARAERDLRKARPFGVGSKVFFQQAEVTPPKEDPKELFIAMTSDRGNWIRIHTDPMATIFYWNFWNFSIW